MDNSNVSATLSMFPNDPESTAIDLGVINFSKQENSQTWNP